MSFNLFALLKQVWVLSDRALALGASWCLRTKAHHLQTMNASPGEVILLAGPSEPLNPYSSRFLCLSVSSDGENYVQRCMFLWRWKDKNLVPFDLQSRVIFSCSCSYEVLLLNKDFEVQKKGEYSSRDDFWTVDCQCSKPCASSDKLKVLKINSHLLYRTEVWVFLLVFCRFTLWTHCCSECLLKF